MSRSFLAVVLAVIVFASACGASTTLGADPETVTPAAIPTVVGQPDATSAPILTPVPAAEPTPVPSGAVSSVDGVRAAVVQINATGTFIDPAAGLQSNVVGSGTGFIIDESGLVVTNNHVVTGAAVLEVLIDGEQEPRNARLLGVSECSDLAVIDIEGDGFDYLEWHDGPIAAGMSIFAAGFPLGDAEYTLLDGIVSKENADGESSWASVDAVIEHSADTLPGNSGGPIVSDQGRVVAVNYAGNDVGQSFAIGREVARPVIDQLRNGIDVDSVGINGEAVSGDGVTGIWVYSVASGSPADLVGLEAGDLITQAESLPMAADGTMSDYCDVLRSRQVNDPIAIEVYRPSTDELLEGRLNGEPLEVTSAGSGNFADEDAPDYDDYLQITDDSDRIVLRIPTEWADTDGGAWTTDGVAIGPSFLAASDVTAWRDGWGTPGVFIGVSDQLPYASVGELLDDKEFSGTCDYVERQPYDDGLYIGELDVWENCGPEGSSFLVIGAEPSSREFFILVEIVIVDERDWSAADEVIVSYEVVLEGTAGGGADGSRAYSEYVSVTDETDAIIVSVPAEWSDIDGRLWDFNDDGDVIGPALTVSPDNDAWSDAWATPGVFMGASAELPYASTTEMLDDNQFGESCTYVDRSPYDDGLYIGYTDLWENCGVVGSDFFVIVAAPADGAFLVLVEIVVVDDRDWAAVDEIVASFEVVLPIS